MTKLHIPHTRFEKVIRPRISDLLDEGLKRKLTLLIAPAGYGKTTALSEWVTENRLPAAWISLDTEDRDPVRFWRYTIKALDLALPDFNDHRLQQLTLSNLTNESMVSALLVELNRLKDSIVMVWEDLHFANNEQVMNDIDQFLFRLPPHVHVYITSRMLPPLMLAKLRIAGEAIILDAETLRFTQEESSKLAAAIFPARLSYSEMAELHQLSEGWVTGLKLLARTYDKKLLSNHRLLSDYFIEEVFNHLPKRMQEFMLYTSIVQRMSGSLCEAVTGMTDSFSLLQELERMNLFLLPLDQGPNWYRYHYLFQKFLRKRLKICYKQKESSLHQAAGAWLKCNGYELEAIEHFIECSSFTESLNVIENQVPMVIKGSWETLQHWLNRVPKEFIFEKPQLYFIYIGVLYLSGQKEDSTALYWWADKRINDPTVMLDGKDKEVWYAGLAFLVAARAYIEQDFATFVEYSRLYLKYRPAGDFLIGFGLEEDGHHRLWESVVTTSGVQQAEHYLPEILKLWSISQNVYLIAHFNIDYGKLHYERNELQKAEQYFRKALEIAEQHDNAYLTVEATLGVTGIYIARGFPMQAEHLLGVIRNLFPEERYPTLAARIQWFEASWAVRKGEFVKSLQWLEKSGLRADDPIPESMLAQYDTVSYVLTAHGRTDEALMLTDRLLHMSKRLERQSDTIRILLHRSLMLEQSGIKAQSFLSLEEALSLAEPGGHIRVFVDEGKPLFALLNSYANERRAKRYRAIFPVSMVYVRKLLRNMTPGQRELEPSRILAKLTSREHEVMLLMADGLSNREIAERLNISLTTVKSHINNLYRKLQVSKRDEAILYWKSNEGSSQIHPDYS